MIQRDRIELELMHVVDTCDLHDLYEALYQSPKDTGSQIKASASAQMNQRLAHAGFVKNCDSTIETGVPLELILKRFNTQNMDLLRVGLAGQAHEGSNASVGVLASNMIYNSPVPVPAVHSRQGKNSNMFLPV